MARLVDAHDWAATPLGPKDRGLPGIDGNELTRRIRSTPTGASALLIAVSGYRSDLDRSTALAAGGG
jgi:CheY-like chemotaxis protein